MARRPLAAILSLSLAALAAASSARSAPPAELTAARARTELAKDFRKGVDLTTVDMLPLSEKAEALGREQVEMVLSLYEQAKLVQLGREPGDSPESFLLVVRSVARRLGVDYPTAERLYAGRVRATRSAAAAPDELSARAAIALGVCPSNRPDA